MLQRDTIASRKNPINKCYGEQIKCWKKYNNKGVENGKDVCIIQTSLCIDEQLIKGGVINWRNR